MFAQNCLRKGWINFDETFMDHTGYVLRLRICFLLHFVEKLKKSIGCVFGNDWELSDIKITRAKRPLSVLNLLILQNFIGCQAKPIKKSDFDYHVIKNLPAELSITQTITRTTRASFVRVYPVFIIIIHDTVVAHRYTLHTNIGSSLFLLYLY